MPASCHLLQVSEYGNLSVIRCIIAIEGTEYVIHTRVRLTFRSFMYSYSHAPDAYPDIFMYLPL